MALIEINGCVFDEDRLALSHGYQAHDAIAQETFVNHIHLDGADAVSESNRIIEDWIAEMRLRWPRREFRIYRVIEPSEVTIRFHIVRIGMANWCEQGVEIITVPLEKQ